jgi:hypothetical protein
MIKTDTDNSKHCLFINWAFDKIYKFQVNSHLYITSLISLTTTHEYLQNI